MKNPAIVSVKQRKSMLGWLIVFSLLAIVAFLTVSSCNDLRKGVVKTTEQVVDSIAVDSTGKVDTFKSIVIEKIDSNESVKRRSDNPAINSEYLIQQQQTKIDSLSKIVNELSDSRLKTRNDSLTQINRTYYNTIQHQTDLIKNIRAGKAR